MKKYRGRVSYDFKIAMVILLFSLTLARLALALYSPSIEIISDKILLGITLFIVIYLWTQEVIDYHYLLRVYGDLKKSNEQLKEAEIDTIASLIKAVEAKDEYTRGHSERVTKIAMAIAEEMYIKEDEKRLIERAGILHDVGKIGIYDAILCKKDKLTDEEWCAIKSHPEKGDEILKPLKFLSTERDIILSHHERYDGKGYPRGLKDDQIRVEALILSVADSFDAMNSMRAYRQPLPKDVIISELTKSRGTQHSARVVDALFSLLKKKPELWEKK